MLALALIFLAACGGKGEEPSTAGSGGTGPGLMDSLGIDTDKGGLVIYIPYWQERLLTPLIARYKARNPRVEVVSEVLGGESDGGYAWQVYKDRVASELMAGTGPDILVPDGLYFPSIYKSMDSGLFADLSGLFGEGGSLDDVDFYMSVMDAGVYKGKRYVIPLSYSLPLLLTGESLLSAMDFDIGKDTDFAALFGEIDRCTERAKTDPAFDRMLTGYFQDYQLPLYAGFSLVDFERREVLPDEEALRTMCEAYRGYHGENTMLDYSTNDHFDLLYTGQSLFSSMANPDANYLVLNVEPILKQGDVPVFTAVRTLDGGLAAVVGDALAVRAGSPNLENAMDFIACALSEEVQAQMGRPYLMGLPVRRATLEGWFDRYASDIDPQIFRDALVVINSVDRCILTDSISLGMYYETMESYYKGERSYEECEAQLRQRLTLYLSE